MQRILWLAEELVTFQEVVYICILMLTHTHTHTHTHIFRVQFFCGSTKKLATPTFFMINLHYVNKNEGVAAV